MQRSPSKPPKNVQLSLSTEAVCRAIISSSLVGIVQTEILLFAVEIRGAFLEFASASNSTPNQAEALQMRWRISGEFSPIPAVNTSPSNPPRTDVKAPISLAAR